MIRIAIIDNRINTEALVYPERVEKYYFEDDLWVKENKNVNKKNYFMTHSTIIAKIIELNLNFEYEIININISLEENEINSNIFIIKKALYFCLDNNIDIINMSIGSEKLSDICYIDDILKKLYINNVTIVAAFSNNYTYTIPAISKYVFSVACDKTNFLKNREIIYAQDNFLNLNFIVNFTEDIGFDIQMTNSFVTPIIVCEIAKIKKLNFSNKDLNKYLRKLFFKENFDFKKFIYKTKEKQDLEKKPMISIKQNEYSDFIFKLAYEFKCNLGYEITIIKNNDIFTISENGKIIILDIIINNNIDLNILYKFFVTDIFIVLDEFVINYVEIDIFIDAMLENKFFYITSKDKEVKFSDIKSLALGIEKLLQ